MIIGAVSRASCIRGLQWLASFQANARASPRASIARLAARCGHPRHPAAQAALEVTMATRALCSAKCTERARQLGSRTREQLVRAQLAHEGSFVGRVDPPPPNNVIPELSTPLHQDGGKCGVESAKHRPDDAAQNKKKPLLALSQLPRPCSVLEKSSRADLPGAVLASEEPSSHLARCAASADHPLFGPDTEYIRAKGSPCPLSTQPSFDHLVTLATHRGYAPASFAYTYLPGPYALMH